MLAVSEALLTILGSFRKPTAQSRQLQRDADQGDAFKNRHKNGRPRIRKYLYSNRYFTEGWLNCSASEALNASHRLRPLRRRPSQPGSRLAVTEHGLF
jgi:hypothetical protein